jgi:hypothetical protein
MGVLIKPSRCFQAFADRLIRDQFEGAGTGDFQVLQGSKRGSSVPDCLIRDQCDGAGADDLYVIRGAKIESLVADRLLRDQFAAADDLYVLQGAKRNHRSTSLNSLLQPFKP